MGELTSALDALAADDLHALGAGPLLERTAELVRLRNRIDAELARTVRVADLTQAPEHDGQKTMRSWLRGHARLSPAAAAAVIRQGRVIEQLPAVGAAFADGQVTGEQVSVVAPVVSDQRRAAAAEQGVDLAEVDRVLAETAATRPHADLARVVHHYRLPRSRRHRTRPHRGALPDHRDARRWQRQRPVRARRGRRGEVEGPSPPHDSQARRGPLGMAVSAPSSSATPSSSPPTCCSPRGRRRSCARSSRTSSSRSPSDLVDPTTGPCAGTTGFGAEISAGRARWLACDGNVTRIVVGPEGQPLDLGRSHRVVPPHLRRAVEHRDRHCVFAGCQAPTHWCDVHHVQEWLVDEGETSLENSALLCERHHTKVHHGFRVERQPDGRWRTYRPDGSEILLHPLRF
jgi:hypothetical protein